jgi:hypothetical protein
LPEIERSQQFRKSSVLCDEQQRKTEQERKRMRGQTTQTLCRSTEGAQQQGDNSDVVSEQENKSPRLQGRRPPDAWATVKSGDDARDRGADRHRGCAEKANGVEESACRRQRLVVRRFANECGAHR